MGIFQMISRLFITASSLCDAVETTAGALNRGARAIDHLAAAGEGRAELFKYEVDIETVNVKEVLNARIAALKAKQKQAQLEVA